MANGLYNDARAGFLLGEIDWDTAVIKVGLVRAYTFAASHKFVSDVTTAGGVIHATSAALTTKTGVAGTADAADFTFSPDPAANASGHGLLVFQSSAVTGGADVAATAQRVIAWYDTGTNLPITPNGGTISVTWNASGLFTI